MTDIDERVRKVLRESLALNASDRRVAGIKRADDLLGLDSIATIEFVIGLEKEFGITLDPGSLDSSIFADLSRLVALIAAQLRSAP